MHLSYSNLVGTEVYTSSRHKIPRTNFEISPSIKIPKEQYVLL